MNLCSRTSGHNVDVHYLFYRRLEQRKAKLADKKRQKKEDRCGGFAALKGKFVADLDFCIQILPEIISNLFCTSTVTFHLNNPVPKV
jgi:hypothetical protein